MATRTSMADLVRRLRDMLDNPAGLTDEQIQDLLDEHRRPVDQALRSRAPFYTQHEAGIGNFESGVKVYTGYDTLLTLTTDYTIDLQTGVVTTGSADRRELRIWGTAYDLNRAAADGWERIASGVWDEFDLSDNGSSLSRSQKIAHARSMADRYRRKAGGGNARTARSDSAAGAGDEAARLWADRIRVNRH